MSGINELVKRLERLGSAEVKKRIMERAATVCRDQCYVCFTHQRDPYGKPWAARKPPTGNWALLDKTGAGYDSITAVATKESAKVAILGRMKWHQTGTAKMTARKFFPEQSRGLGLWAEPVSKAAVDAVREMMTGE